MCWPAALDDFNAHLAEATAGCLSEGRPQYWPTGKNRCDILARLRREVSDRFSTDLPAIIASTRKMSGPKGTA
jgi:hypothetical protein